MLEQDELEREDEVEESVEDDELLVAEDEDEDVDEQRGAGTLFEFSSKYCW